MNSSEITLVHVAPSIYYYLTSTDLSDTVIFADPALPLYRVVSDAKRMTIYDGTKPDSVIAVYRRRGFFSDTISFPSFRRNGGGNKSNVKTRTERRLKIDRWLRPSKPSHDETAIHTVDTEYGPYILKAMSRHRSNVFTQDDLETPVASCYLYRSLPSTQPAIVLQSAGEPVRDDIVVAYLIQRYRMMLESKSAFKSSPKYSINTGSSETHAYAGPGAIVASPRYFMP